MRFLVLVENFRTITGEEEVRRLRERVREKVDELHDSGRVIESGVFADRRGGFFLLEADSGAELARLLFPMHDWAQIQTRPVYAFDELGELFRQGR